MNLDYEDLKEAVIEMEEQKIIPTQLASSILKNIENKEKEDDRT